MNKFQNEINFIRIFDPYIDEKIANDEKKGIPIDDLVKREHDYWIKNGSKGKYAPET